MVTNTDDIQPTCNCPEDEHVEGCPFDTCPIGQCSPTCRQVTDNPEDEYCDCGCHG